MARCKLRPQVALAFFGSANVREQQRENVAVEQAAAHDFHRRNAQPLLVNFPARPHRAGVGPSDIGVMRARRDVEIRMRLSGIGGCL